MQMTHAEELPFIGDFFNGAWNNLNLLNNFTHVCNYKRFYDVLTITLSLSSDAMLDCNSTWKDINSFPRAWSVMCNSCAASAKFLVGFNDFWMVWLSWKAQWWELTIKTSICFHRMMGMHKNDGGGYK